MQRNRISALCLPATVLLLSAMTAWAAPAKPPPAADKTLFDFEQEESVKAWSARHDAKSKDPDPSVQWIAEGPAGKHAFQITFNGGEWPAVTTGAPAVDDWTPFNTLKVVVVVARPCVMGFRAYSDEAAAADSNAHWEKTAFLHAGENGLALPILPNAKFSGKDLRRFDIYLYRPQAGETARVGSIQLANVKAPPAAAVEFSVAGSDLKASNPLDLAAKLKAQPAKDAPGTVEQTEAAFRAKYEEMKKTHPRALLAILRDGEKGWDAADPEKVYGGWKDTIVFTHPPDANLQPRARNYGAQKTLICYSRNTQFRLMQADLSVIPNGSAILAAQLALIRKSTGAADPDAAVAPAMRVFEPCNREWNETEVNAYQYADGKAWKELGGAAWDGDDPDFLPLYVAYGFTQGAGVVHAWDFTEAVRFWTSGAHPNRGFCLYSAYHEPDAWRAAPTRRSANVKDRPALMVIYEPKDPAK